jgi:hypothetical protein
MLPMARNDKRWFLKDVLPKLRRKREDEEEKSSRRAERKWIGSKTLPPDHTRTLRRGSQWSAHHFCSQ